MMLDKPFALVAKIIDGTSLVINKGVKDGVTQDMKFIVVGIGESIIDPSTGEDLGSLELIRGWCSPTHIQEKITTIQSNRFVREESRTEIVKSSSLLRMMGEGITERVVPGNRYRENLENPKIGDHVRLY